MDRVSEPTAAGADAAGRLRIYLGAAAGVGKTYAMLNEGHRRKGAARTSLSGSPNDTASG